MPKHDRFLKSLAHVASAALVAAVFALATPASAQTSGVMSAEQLSSLTAQANEAGSVRVLIELDTPGLEAGLSADQVSAQRASIAAAQADMVSAFGEGSVNRTYETVPMIAMTLNASQLSALQSMSGVSAVFADELSEPSMTGSTRLTRARIMWRRGITGDGTHVAVLDTGIAYNNRAFRPLNDVIATSACFSSNSPGVSRSACWFGDESRIGLYEAPAPDLSISGSGHGTHVAATVAANRPRALRGMAPDALLIPIQVFSIFADDSGYCNGGTECMLAYTSDQLAALDQIYLWVQAQTYNIAAVNMSLGGGNYTNFCNGDSRATVIQNLRAAGTAVVIATGNSYYTNAVGAPACIEAAVSVGATDDNDNIASFSNQANGLVDLMAPGVNILAAYPDTRTSTNYLSGTSMATPHVAGAFALLRQAYPNHTVSQLETALECTGVTVSRAGTSGTYQRIHLTAARQYLNGYGTWPNCPG